MDTGVKITQLRLPAPLHERVREQAYRRRTSLNKTMVALIEAGLEEKQEVRG
jgi:predicted HicB family RNase H-like nuclease